MKLLINKKTKRFYIHAEECDVVKRKPDTHLILGSIPYEEVGEDVTICECVYNSPNYQSWILPLDSVN